MTTEVLVALRAQLVVHEGDKGFPYDDKTGRVLKPGETLQGNLTIGVGHNLSAKPLSARVRALILDDDIDECQIDLMAFGWFLKLDAPRMRAVLDLRFNVGPAKFRTFKKMLAALDRMDFRTAADELQSSIWATQVQPARRDRLVAMLATGQDAQEKSA